LLWHRDEPIGICIFAAPAAGLKPRARYFGMRSSLTGDALAALTGQLWVLARVVIHPTWRGAGLASAFVRRSCALCPVPWIEALAAMGHVNPFFEKAGFVRAGVVRKATVGREPVYYVLDNRLLRRSDAVPLDRQIPDSLPSICTSEATDNCRSAGSGQ